MKELKKQILFAGLHTIWLHKFSKKTNMIGKLIFGLWVFFSIRCSLAQSHLMESMSLEIFKVNAKMDLIYLKENSNKIRL